MTGARKENTQEGVLYSGPGQRVLCAFFARFFVVAQHKAVDLGEQVVRCGPPQPPGCGAGLKVRQFAVACVPRATRHGRAIPEHTAPAESAHARFLFVCSVAPPPPFAQWPVCASMGAHGRSAASRPSLATRILPRFFLSRSLRVFLLRSPPARS